MDKISVFEFLIRECFYFVTFIIYKFSILKAIMSVL